MGAGTWPCMYKAIPAKIDAMYPGSIPKWPECHVPMNHSRIDAQTPDSVLFIEVLISGILMLGVRLIRETEINHETLTFTNN